MYTTQRRRSNRAATQVSRSVQKRSVQQKQKQQHPSPLNPLPQCHESAIELVLSTFRVQIFPRSDLFNILCAAHIYSIYFTDSCICTKNETQTTCAQTTQRTDESARNIQSVFVGTLGNFHITSIYVYITIRALSLRNANGVFLLLLCVLHIHICASSEYVRDSSV